jgi:hypothetical protein
MDAEATHTQFEEHKEIMTEDSSIFASTGPSMHSNPEKVEGVHDEEPKDDQGNANSEEEGEELTYPPMATRLLVAVGLALAIFLVIRLIFKRLISPGFFRSDHCRHRYTNYIRSLQIFERCRLVCFSFFRHNVSFHSYQIDDLRAALQPTFGKIYKVFNVKWVFLIAVTVFESIVLFVLL